MTRRFGAIALRVAVSAALLGAVLVGTEPAAVARLLAGINPVWLLPVLLISVVQVALSAWRWRFTAARLGIELRWGRALAEYYLATFLNQVLPGGVTGDAARAWRHGRLLAEYGPAVRAVVIERASGQLVMAAVAVTALLAQPGLLAQLPAGWAWQVVLATVALALLGALLAVLVRSRHGAPLRRFASDLRRALLAPAVLPIQLVTSIAVVATYIAVYWSAARARGIDTPAAELLPLVPLVLLAMLIPLSVSGWGFREAAAALLWPLAGLPASEGVAIAVAYGLFVLLASLPGLLVAVARPAAP